MLRAWTGPMFRGLNAVLGIPRSLLFQNSPRRWALARLFCCAGLRIGNLDGLRPFAKLHQIIEVCSAVGILNRSRVCRDVLTAAR